MVELTNPFFSLAGQKERLTNVVDTFKMIGSNLIQGKLLTGVPVSKKFEGSLVEPLAKAVTTPAFIAAAPAVAATGIVYGGAIATGVKTAVAGVSAGVTSAYKKATGAAKDVQAIKAALPSNPPAPVASPIITQAPLQTPKKQVVVKTQAQPSQQMITQPIAAAPQVIQALPQDTTTFLKDPAGVGVTGLPINPITNTGIESQGEPSKAPRSPQQRSAKRKTAKKSARSRKGSKRSRGSRRSPRGSRRSHGSKARKGSHRIHYTKKNQPYIILASGKARFIKKSSAHNRKERKGGYY